MYYFPWRKFTQDANAATHSLFASLKAKITAGWAKFDVNNVAKTYYAYAVRLAPGVGSDGE